VKDISGQKIVGIVLSCFGIFFMILSGVFTYSAGPYSTYCLIIGFIFILVGGVIVRVSAKKEY